MSAAHDDATIARTLARPYPHGFVTDIESETLPPGLDENTIREISRRKREPEFLLKRRLEALEKWMSMPHPDWAKLRIEPIDFRRCPTTRRPSRWRTARRTCPRSIPSCSRPTRN